MTGARLLEHVLRTGSVPDWYEPTDLFGPSGHAIRRFVGATRVGVTGADWAVLLRQCLRRLPSGERVQIARLDETRAALLREVDVRQELDGRLEAEPYQPAWIADLGNQSIDLPTMGAPAPEQPVAGEPWLRQLMGKDSWKSAAQRDVVWRALNSRPNSTMLIGLPTGSGKSLVYQCCAAFEQSMTVLVVPTIALGLDQLAAVRDLPCARMLGPVLYTPGEDAEDALDAVQSRRSRLLITSPEAIVTGRLNSLLRRHAEEGLLGRVVVDEAHLIESWGAEFRIEFQLLAATLREWRALAPSTGIRTLLLSATFAPSTPAMLRELFAPDAAPWEQHIVQHLRSEIHYFAAEHWMSADEQVQRVEAALKRLPRPAILYVTEVQEAVRWGVRLQEAGFARSRVFHGNTSPADRKAIMKAWRADELDVVVGTSAFGMGVDKADVRAIVHACFPEGIDRFYQEVGRGGRDGDHCISLLAPTQKDYRVARTMGPTLLSDPEKVNGRWQAMWQSREPIVNAGGVQADTFRVNTREQSVHRFGSESFGENATWNKRLLLMMDRAGLIRIESLTRQRLDDDAENVETAVIRALHSTTELHGSLHLLLDQPRKREREGIQRAMEGLERVFLRQGTVCRELQTQYGLMTRRACGSCYACRTGRERPVSPGVLRLEEEDAVTRPMVQVVQGPALQGGRQKADLIKALRQVLQSHWMDRFVVDGVHRSALEELIERADDRGDRPYRIDNLDPDNVPTVLPDETILVIHFDVIDERAGDLNRRGSRVTHWLLGGSIERTPGRWPFMYEHKARAYPGLDGLSQWLTDMRLGAESHPAARLD
jgi:ATP-dependent DNA helicase RecQ